ncbi:Fic family protein [uncultured Desulfobacter sp.]|uniref:Fic/DOC family protein n=1 Tax=uncultured Desulfobacter sp. TaxID=240139 RepID=UPI002AA6875D|nr:Fic family protein [uncultured Desulfobacter sp.]
MKRYKVAKPHLIPGTNILKNKPGITNQKDLDRFELLSFLARLDTVPDGDFSTYHLKQIHAHTLQDVYDWAGEFRNVPIEKGISVFCRPEFIKQEIDKITKSIVISELRGMSTEAFSKKLTEIVSELNAVHPFLDGNGRAIRVYVQKISIAVGFRLDVSKLRGESWNIASEKSFFGNNQDLLKILKKNLSRIREL